MSTADLDARYLRLFGHTARGLVCPCETEYGPGGGFQQPQQLADLAGYYRAFGLRMPSGHDHRVDHVACECEFMDFLCCKEAFWREQLRGGPELVSKPSVGSDFTAPPDTVRLKADTADTVPVSAPSVVSGFSRTLEGSRPVVGTDSQRTDTLEQTRKAARTFVRDHLGQFGRAFGHQLIREDGEGFYARLGRVLLQFLDLECQLLDVEAGSVSLSVRLDQIDDVPMACDSGESLIQIRRREDYEQFS